MKFFLSPVEIVSNGDNSNLGSILLKCNILDDYINENGKVIKTKDEPLVEIKCGLIIRSIGYRSTPIDDSLPFDMKRGIIKNNEGRVEDNVGLYCSGWAAFGATGVIINTMNASFEVGKNIQTDIDAGLLDSDFPKLGYLSVKPLLEQRNSKVIDFIDWQKIDQYEQDLGKKEGKPREKIVSFDEYLSKIKQDK